LLVCSFGNFLKITGIFLRLPAILREVQSYCGCTCALRTAGISSQLGQCPFQPANPVIVELILLDDILKMSWLVGVLVENVPKFVSGKF